MSNWKKGKLLNNDQYVVESILLRSGYGVFYRVLDQTTNQTHTVVTTEIFWQEKANAEELENKLIKQAKKIFLQDLKGFQRTPGMRRTNHLAKIQGSWFGSP